MQSGLTGVTPKTVRRYRLLFLLAALSDGVLGIAFLVAAGPLFAWLAAPPLVNPTFVQLLAGFIAVQGLGYVFVWQQPWRNVDIVKLGSVAKLVWVGATVAALARGDLPHPGVSWLAVVEACFLIGFLFFLRTASDVRHQTRTAARAGRALDPARHWTRDG